MSQTFAPGGIPQMKTGPRPKTNTYSFDGSGMNCPLAAYLRLNPLVRMSGVSPAGDRARADAWPAVKAGSAPWPGLRYWKVDPGAAVGVMNWPVGVNSAVATAPDGAKARAQSSPSVLSTRVPLFPVRDPGSRLSNSHYDLKTLDRRGLSPKAGVLAVALTDLIGAACDPVLTNSDEGRRGGAQT